MVSPAKPVIAVTGAASGAGLLLVRRLAASDDVKTVLALDIARVDVPGATWRAVDVTSAAIGEQLAGVDVVVHVGDIPAAAGVLRAAEAAGVDRVVVVTSAAVYGASADNPVPLPEDAPLGAAPDGSVMSDLLEVERLADAAARTRPTAHVVVLRPALMVGPGVDTVLTRHFEAPRILVVRGHRPSWQFCHLDDLASALELAALGGLDSAQDGQVAVVAVGSDGALGQAEVEQITGRRSIELSPSLAFGAAERLGRLGVTPGAAAQLRYVVHPWVVAGERLRAAGWSPAYTNADALRAQIEQAGGRRVIGSYRLGAKDAAAGAAVGATLAAVGTAALVRRARRRRRA